MLLVLINSVLHLIVWQLAYFECSLSGTGNKLLILYLLLVY